MPATGKWVACGCGGTAYMPNFGDWEGRRRVKSLSRASTLMEVKEEMAKKRTKAREGGAELDK